MDPLQLWPIRQLQWYFSKSQRKCVWTVCCLYRAAYSFLNGIKEHLSRAICPYTVSYDHIQGVMALTLFEDFVYWTDGKSKSLRRAHKTTGAQGIELLNSWQAIKSIKVYHSLRQPEGTKSNLFILSYHAEQRGLQVSVLLFRRKLFV